MNELAKENENEAASCLDGLNRLNKSSGATVTEYQLCFLLKNIAVISKKGKEGM